MRCAASGLTPALLLLLAWTKPAFGQEPTRAESAAVPESRAGTIQPPRAEAPLSAAYPEGAHGEATVVVELLVGRNGEVSEARTLSGDEPFASAALDAAKGWRFYAAERDGQAIAARVRLSVHFVPPEEAQAEPSLASPPGPTTDHATATNESEAAEQPIELTVIGVREPKRTSLSRAEVRQLPGAFGDPFRAIEILPGVTPIASGLPYFYVRGAPPGNVGYYLDGVRVPALYHAAVGPSVIHPAFIDHVDLFPGPYPARFGHFAGGIVAAETAPPAYRLRGEASLRLVDAGAMLEAPFADNHADIMVAGRYSYTGAIISLFVPELEIGYWDYQARATRRLNATDTLTLFGFGSHDFAAQLKNGELRTLYDVTFHRLELGFERSSSDGRRLRVSATGGLDDSASEEDGFRVQDRNIGVRADFEQRLDGKAVLRTGSEARLDSYEASSDVRVFGNEFLNDFRARFPDRDEIVLGGYLEMLLEPEPGVRVTPGLRGDFYGSGGEDFGLSPRVMAEFDVTDDVMLSNGIGVARQPPSFVIPIPGLAPKSGAGLQTALQSSAGVHVKLKESMSASLTLFQSAFLNTTDAFGVSRLDNGDFTLTQSSRSLGNARGVELMLQRSLTERIGGFLSYTLSRSERSLGRASGPSTFDRTHVLNLALAFDLGKGYRAGGRLTAYSGIPGDVAYVEAAKHPPRTPPFYRFDWRFEKRWSLGREGAFWALVAEVLNTTLHQEVLNVSCNAYTCRQDTIGPVTIPSLGIEAGF